MSQAPEKIWINPSLDLPKLNGVIDKDSVQYVHKDAFEKLRLAVRYKTRYSRNGWDVAMN